MYKQTETKTLANLENGVEIQPVATLRHECGGVAHIWVDDHRYVLGLELMVVLDETAVNIDGEEVLVVRPTNYIFHEAMEVLRKLPPLFAPQPNGDESKAPAPPWIEKGRLTKEEIEKIERPFPWLILMTYSWYGLPVSKPFMSVDDAREWFEEKVPDDVKSQEQVRFWSQIDNSKIFQKSRQTITSATETSTHSREEGVMDDELKKDIDTMITNRILLFYGGLIERGQIKHVEEGNPPAPTAH